MSLPRAARLLRATRVLPLFLFALLLASSGALFAQRDRSPANDTSDRAVDVQHSESDSPPPEPPPDPPSDSSPSDTSSTPPPDPPSDSPSDTSDSTSPPERYAVPGTPGEAHRQPPSRDRHDPNGSGGASHPENDDQEVISDAVDESFLLPYWHDGRNRQMGALDLDVKPGRTQVYLNGQYMGTADHYDGWPSYLWLEEGTYEIVFYLDGYRTLARQVSVHPGMVINFEDHLEKGESIRPNL
jgi:hypothetical protein